MAPAGAGAETMFDTLTEKLDQTVRRLRGLGKISERNIEEAVREVRLALLEADVHYQVVQSFTDRVLAKAVGHEVLGSLTPEQQFIRIVDRELTELMGGTTAKLNLSATPPV